VLAASLQSYKDDIFWGEFFNLQEIKDEEGLQDLLSAGISVYAEGKTIVVEGANNEITITDALGRVMANNQSPLQKQTFAVPNAGVYIVKIGNNAVSVLVK